jgi:PAS domain S-box-containing protein
MRPLPHVFLFYHLQQQLQTSLQQKTSNSQTQLQLSSQQELNSQAQKMIKQPSKGLSQMPSTVTKHPADSIQGTQEYCSMPSNGSNILKPEPVDIRTLQTYTLEQLEAYVKNLKQRNQPIPNTVKVLLEHEQQIAAKRLSKRISNRKSATVSRNRQRKLIESLLAENKRLRRDALILSHLPDAIVVIGLDGTIKFCNAQMTRITNHSAHELEGRSIKDFLASGSWRPLRHLIHDLEDAERIAASEGWIDNDSADSDGKTSSDGSVSYDNSISISMGKERDNASESTDRTSSKSSNNRENDFGHAALPFKKRKANYDISLNFDMNAGDEMSDSVTSNDADAKLSSLAHHPKSGLSNGHGFKRHKVMLLQDDIKEYCNLDKHMRSRSSYNSNFESSGESTENSSLFMKDSNIIDGQFA